MVTLDTGPVSPGTVASPCFRSLLKPLSLSKISLLTCHLNKLSPTPEVRQTLVPSVSPQLQVCPASGHSASAETRSRPARARRPVAAKTRHLSKLNPSQERYCHNVSRIVVLCLGHIKEAFLQLEHEMVPVFVLVLVLLACEDYKW